MEGSADGSPPSSLWMIHAAELFPKPPMEKEDDQLSVPFQELAGESVKYLGRTDDGVLALSNYRLFLLKNSTYLETSVPLGLIESAQTRDLFHLLINCKDASTVKCSFETAEQCSEWQRRITLSVGVPETLESLFAFPFYSWTSDSQTTQTTATHNGNVINNNGISGSIELNTTANNGGEWSGRLQRAGRFEDDFRKEVERLQFDLNGVWRISSANEELKLCPSYPPLILVPCCISDDKLQNVANFRGSRRLPAVVWRHKQSGAVIARSSQPEVGWLGWRNSKDEQLLKALADACAFDRGEQNRRQNLCISGDSTPSSAEGSHEEVCMDEIRKILIVDARSYTSAVTNRARGGGCECIEYYPCAEIEFMNLSNIHAIRKSFHTLRQLCASPPDIPNWLGLLERTMWLQHLSGLLAASMTVCHAIEKKGRPVLVHCSDGWDRTPQIVATAELCLDPFYRTVEGFRILVEREWLNFGHKFADRCGHGPGSDEVSERCPVFLQWLDIVHQIHRQFPCSFEFSMAYLIKLAQHSHSCLFGTFLCNSLKERMDNTVLDRTFSVWPFLSGSIYRNPLYVPNKEKVLWPAHNVRDLVLWSEVYLGSLGNQNSSDCPPNTSDANQGSTSPMTKTRSYGDLMTAGSAQNGLTRRSSDPNMTVESHLIIPINHSDNNSSMDASSDRDDNESPDIITNIIHDTTEKLQNLTNELNQSDEEIYKINNVEVEDVIEQQKQQQNNKNVRPLPDHRHHNHHIDNSVKKYENHVNNINNKDGIKTVRTTACFQINNESSLFHKNSNNYCHHPTTEILLENGNNDVATTITTAMIEIHDNIITDKNNKEYDENDGDDVDNVNNSMVNGSKICIDVVDSNSCSAISTQQLSNDNNLDKNSVMLESVDLKDLSSISSSSPNHTSLELQQNLWHGSINTSTDTLVPIESLQQQQKQLENCDEKNNDCNITTNGIINRNAIVINNSHSNSSLVDENTNSLNTQQQQKKLNITTLTSNILPEVHYKINNFQHISNSVNTTSTSNNNIISNNKTSNNFNVENANNTNSINHNPNTSSNSNIVGMMDESILILPEHQKLEISISGKCETVNSSSGSSSNNTIINANSLSSSLSSPMQLHQHHSQQQQPRRRRTSSTNSRNDQNNISKNYSASITNSRFSTPGGIRSLPLTPPGVGSLSSDRNSVSITCPDGLAHALSEQNIRLQQIVYEHKLREDALLRELHGMRMALLKKTCPHCNSQPLVNDEQTDVMKINDENKVFVDLYDCYSSSNCERNYFNDDDDDDDALNSCYGTSTESSNSIMDNIENLSICSWEAVEDRSGPSSGASSTQPPNAGGCNSSNSVLWVPDHAVTRCTGCQTEFWLGRRKHHCRSCGQIFCADCSEYWAPLPDERLYTPVRLCGPCFQSVTVITQKQQQQMRIGNNCGIQYHQQQQSSMITTTNESTTTTFSTTKNSASSSLITSPSTSSILSNTYSTITTISSNCNNIHHGVSLSFTKNNNSTNSNSNVVISTSSTATTTTSMEDCKHAANSSIKDRGPLKATAASN